MKQNKNRMEFVLCIKNENYLVSLTTGKIYQVIQDEKAAQENFLRIIDESGEDYIYPKSFFVGIHVPKEAQDIFPVRAVSN